MAKEGSKLRPVDSINYTEDNEVQPADFPSSSLASLHLRDEAVVIDESKNHMGDTTEPHSVCPVMRSSVCNQSQQQIDKSLDTRPVPSPAVQGEVKDAKSR